MEQKNNGDHYKVCINLIKRCWDKKYGSNTFIKQQFEANSNPSPLIPSQG